MRIMRPLPPRGRYWYQNVREPEGRMRRPKPFTSVSQRKSWPVLGRCARFTLASVSFFPCGPPTAYRQHFAPQVSSGALRRNMAGYVGKSRQTGGCPRFYMGQCGGARGRPRPQWRDDTTHASIARSGTKADRQVEWKPPSDICTAPKRRVTRSLRRRGRGASPQVEAERRGGLQFSLGQKLRMIALHKSQQPVATTSSFFIRLLRELVACSS